MAYCWRVGCTVIGGGAGFIASSAAIDQALEAGGQSKIFLPIIGKGISSVFGNKDKDPVSIYDNIQKNIKELSSAEERNKYIFQCISKIDSEDLNDTNISDLDKSEIKKALEEVSKANQEELKVFRSKILSEIEKLKTNK
jgi:L-asparaginase/Glu-tRNA(Gln) amidotransferase subunit D